MGKYVLTGGATGIGAAIKQQLLDQGHNIVVIDLKDGDYLADLGDPVARKTVIDQVKAEHPSIDGLITCAGVASQFPNPAKILQINYFGTVEIIEGLSENIASGGRVVAISSNSAPMSTFLIALQSSSFQDVPLHASQTTLDCCVSLNCKPVDKMSVSVIIFSHFLTSRSMMLLTS